jgi:arylsulfatase A-like enzyme
MNFIIIISDTFRRDYLGCYGNGWIRTPDLDRLAAESVVFDHARAASFPTVPNRRDVLTGRFTFSYCDWAPLPPEELVLPQVMGEAGYRTMMILDTPHIVAHGYNFTRGFHGWDWVRGQEHDEWRTSPRDPALPCAPEKLRAPFTTVKQYLRNVSDRRREVDYFAPQTMARAMRWLEENLDCQPFLLYVDTFDPHEPWDPPRWYVDPYDPGYTGEEVIYPRYAPCDFLSPAELKHVRALYAGEVTMVDAWVGRLLARVDQLGLRENTVVIFTTDHGFYHGEHGLMGKSIISEQFSCAVPLYDEVARIPLMVRVPGLPAGRREAFAQPPDLMPTILDLAGVPIPDTVQGRSLASVLRGETDKVRPVALTSPSIIYGVRARRFTTITDGEWTLIHPGARVDLSQAASSSIVDSIRRIEKATYAGAGGPELYHLPTDPGQRNNIFDQHRDVAARLHAEHVKVLASLGTAEEHLANRRVLEESDG